jgi:hypothetical protein
VELIQVVAMRAGGLKMVGDSMIGLHSTRRQLSL